ncbi:hypothetical protein BKA69DRAFT_1128813 [Paraphysoderma sedebokerense]|nr:hypothetical protein BKA69DRAFT_1128813 [Paraphysoderma sedebokerense]
MASQTPPSSAINWSISADEKQKFTSYFQNAGAKDGKLNGDSAREFFMKSKLPVDTLSQVWLLADTTKSGSLSLPQFMIAMFLINRVLENKLQSIPQSLPPSFVANVMGNGTSAASSPSPFATSFGNVTPQDTTGTIPATPLQPQKTGGSIIQNNTGAGFGFPYPLQPQRTGSVSPFAPKPVEVHRTGASIFSQDVDLFNPSTTSTSTTDWAVKPEQKSQFDGHFDTLDTTKKGYLTGEECAGFFIRSKLPETTLAKIWDLADISKTGRLTRDEFAVALYLILKVKIANEPLPTVLPNNLIPPSSRQSQGPGLRRRLSTSSLRGTLPKRQNDLGNLLDESVPGPSTFPGLSANSFDAPEINKMNSQIADFQTKTTELKQQRNQLEMNLPNITSQKNDLLIQLSQAKALLEAETNLVNNLQAMYKQESLQLENHRQELSALESSYTTLQAEKQAISNSIERDRNEAAVLSGRIASINMEISNFRRELDRLKEEASKEREKTMGIKQTVDNLEAMKEQIKGEYEKAKALPKTDAASLPKVFSPTIPASSFPNSTGPQPPAVPVNKTGGSVVSSKEWPGSLTPQTVAVNKTGGSAISARSEWDDLVDNHSNSVFGTTGAVPTSKTAPFTSSSQVPPQAVSTNKTGSSVTSSVTGTKPENPAPSKQPNSAFDASFDEAFPIAQPKPTSSSTNTSNAFAAFDDAFRPSSAPPPLKTDVAKTGITQPVKSADAASPNVFSAFDDAFRPSTAPSGSASAAATQNKSTASVEDPFGMTPASMPAAKPDFKFEDAFGSSGSPPSTTAKQLTSKVGGDAAAASKVPTKDTPAPSATTPTDGQKLDFDDAFKDLTSQAKPSKPPAKNDDAFKNLNPQVKAVAASSGLVKAPSLEDFEAEFAKLSTTKSSSSSSNTLKRNEFDADFNAADFSADLSFDNKKGKEGAGTTQRPPSPLKSSSNVAATDPFAPMSPTNPPSATANPTSAAPVNPAAKSSPSPFSFDANFDAAFPGASPATTTPFSSNSTTFPSSIFPPPPTSAPPSYSSPTELDSIFGASPAASNNAASSNNTSQNAFGTGDPWSTIPTSSNGPSKPTQDKRSSVGSNGDIQQVSELMNMGFTREQAVDALERYEYDLQKATNFLLDHGSK